MDDRIMLAHGGGGALSRELIAEVILPALGASAEALPDVAILSTSPSSLISDVQNHLLSTA